ncbi:MAG TPA: S8 family peptidase [Acidimicrobiia bacterium]
MRRKLLVVVAALATAFATAIPAGAGPAGLIAATDNSRAPYIVVMEAQPVLGNEEIAPEGSEAPEPDAPAVEEYVEELLTEKTAVLEGAGVDPSAMVASYDYATNGFSALLTEAEADALSTQKGVASVVRDELHQLHTTNSPHFLGLDDRRGAYASGYTGEGVVVGVIDTGIWPEHPSFEDLGNLGPSPIKFEEIDLDPDPATEFLSTGCDFGNTGYNPDDDDFTCNNKLIGARNMRSLYDTLIPGELYHSARDYDGHGTHTASTAAGNADVPSEIFGRDFGEVSGIAPDAWVVMYSACGDLGCFGGDLADAIDQSVADGVDVINYSIGSDTPGLNGPDDIAFLFAADAGVFAATSNGNSGPGAETVGSPATVPWVTSVGASQQKKTYVAEVRTGDSTQFKSRWSHWFNKDRGVYEGASITPGTDGQLPFVDAGDHGNELCDPAVDFDPDITGMVVLCLRGDVARVEKSQAVSEQGGLGMVLYNNDDIQALVTDNHFVPSVHVSFTDGTALKQYIVDNGADATVELTDGETVRQRGNIMADFSSRGPVGLPASPDIIKPDVTAPGVNILAGNSPTPSLGAPGQLFQSISGTSMSSPHVAGLFALLKQAHPEWSPAMAKSALMTTARQDVRKEDGTTQADPFDFGAGHVDPSGKASSLGSIFNPGLVYDADLFDYVGFTCGADAQIFTPGSCDFVAGLGVPLETYNLNYPSIGVSEVPGTKTVVRTVTNVSDKTTTYRARIHDPRGYDVDVSPNRLKLAPGESATFEITILNEEAPVGEWRFGSLTWVSGHNKVRSPIAVKAAALEVPGAISGEGESGTASFPVAFGYTGAYTAAPHGMAPNVPALGSVDQDPNNSNWSPSEVEGTRQHPIVVDGAAHLRIALTADDITPSAGVDIDLFLYNSAGERVAQSTAGGTDELIDVSLPTSDTYILYVNGWQTTFPPGGGEVAYSLSVWTVPLASGGSLSVTNAPASATLGTIGTVEVAWSGLTPPGGYLGAVSHSDDAGILGLTLVQVGS